ncbi:MAG: tetratricopeptide repeat protein [Phycisphaerales bacterium]
MRLVAAFAAPAAFLLLLEGVLTLCAVGYPTSFFVKSERRGFLTTNAHFGWHYQQETLAEPQPCLIPIEKPRDGIRVFVLGESAAMGTPDPSFGFARILETMLRRCFPDRPIEVVNAAMRGINSHVITQISRECAGLDPDVVVAYVGNNEFNGLYGPKTSLSFLGRRPALIPGFHFVKQTHTGQLLRRLLGANPEARQDRRPKRDRGYFEDHRTAFDDPERDWVYRNFRVNLERICRYSLDAGAGVIVSTVGVNLRDCPPLGSLHRRDLTAPQREQWDRLYQEGVGFETQGDVEQAACCYGKAMEIDDHYAELHFRMARCRLATGDLDSARCAFALARDWDALQFRADRRINEIVREVAGGVARLVEVDRSLAESEACHDGIPGREFFYEHVHLRFPGDYHVARAILPAILDCLRQRGTTPDGSVEVPTSEQCARDLAFTSWDEVNTAAAMAKLTAHPPFTGQLEHARRQAEVEKAVATVMERVDERFVNEVVLAYRQAIAARPDDWVLQYNLGTFLHQLGRPQGAVPCFEQVVRTVPDFAPYHVLLGHALRQAGLIDQAVRQFHEALKRDARCKPAREGLIWADARKKLGR